MTIKNTVLLVGGGPMALMTALEFIRNAPEKITDKITKLIIVSREKKQKLGWGDIIDTLHPEVIFNVTAANMSMDPRNPDQLIQYLTCNPLTECLQKKVNELNTSALLSQQYLPRQILQQVAQKLAIQLELEADEKGIFYEFIHGEVINIHDNILEDQRTEQKSEAIVTIVQLQDSGKIVQKEITATVVALAFGAPKSLLQDEELLAEVPGFISDPHHPSPSNSLYPDFNFDTLQDDHIIGITGSKLTAVDIALIYHARGYFKHPNRKLYFISPSGEFPYPQAAGNSNADGSYQDASFTKNLSLPASLRHPVTAQDLADVMILSCLYAAGLTYDGNILSIPKHVQDTGSVLHNLSHKGQEVLKRKAITDPTLVEKFHTARKRVYDWQLAIDCDFRPHMETIWSRFDAREKKIWNRDFESLWNKLRHRVPVNVYHLLVKLQSSGHIVMMRGKVTSMREEGNRISLFCNNQDEVPILQAEEVIKATGWEQSRPIDALPMLRMARRHYIVHMENSTNLGVVVSNCNQHNVIIIGQLEWIKRKEISGFQQLRQRAITAGVELWQMVNAQEKEIHASLQAKRGMLAIKAFAH
ncbi:MAG: FAD/NAD(P)-binding protein [Pseudomonadota bacterium]